MLIGHSLGTVAAIGLLEREPGWAGAVILEEPPSALAPELGVGHRRVDHGRRRDGA